MDPSIDITNSRLHNVLLRMQKTFSPPNFLLEVLIADSAKLLEQPAAELPKCEVIRAQAFVDMLAQAVSSPVCHCKDGQCPLQLCKVR